MFSTLNGNIIESWDLSPLIEIQNQLNFNDLVIFDVDHTLILEKDKLLRPCRRNCLDRLLARFGERDPERRKKLISIVMLQKEVELLDPYSPILIENLKKQNIKVMVLTAMKTGPIGLIASSEKHRIQELASLGLDFSTTFPDIPPLYFTHLANSMSPPVFESGILFSSHVSKGTALKEFLETIQLYPRQVIFIDNSYNYLKSVEEALCSLGIPFLGIHYKKWLQEPIECNEDIARFQLMYLIDNEKWLNDEEAKVLLNQQKIGWYN